MNLLTRRKSILILAIIFLVNSLAIDLLSPIWPIFISSLGASMTELGLVFSISNAVAAVIQIPSGLLSDKHGRKRLHVLGTLLGAFPPLMFILAGSWMDLLPWVMLGGLATGLYIPIRWALVADLSPNRSMASAYGWTNIAWLIGSTVAPFAGGVIADSLGIRYPFITSFILRFAIVPFAMLLKETRKEAREETAKPESQIADPVNGYKSTMVWFSMINIIQGIGMGVTGPIIPIFVLSNFQVDYTFIGFLYTIGFGVA